MDQLRPAGSGAAAEAVAFVRAVEPSASLVVAADGGAPGDWPAPVAAVDDTLGHALGWTCEVRADDVVILNPLGEGWLRAPRPDLGADWLDPVRHTASAAVYLVAPHPDGPLAGLAAAAADGELRAATVRTAVADAATPDVGRNDPCPCGSGKKFKRCCG